jgi:hypothetical protein
VQVSNQGFRVDLRIFEEKIEPHNSSLKSHQVFGFAKIVKFGNKNWQWSATSFFSQLSQAPNLQQKFVGRVGKPWSMNLTAPTQSLSAQSLVRPPY